MGNTFSRRQFLRQSVGGAAGLGVLALQPAARAAPIPGDAADPEPEEGARGPARVARHPIVREGPAANFLEGAILGNGNLGAVVTPLPDSVMIYFGHNAVWDQRMAPLETHQLGTFDETLRRIRAIPGTLKDLMEDPWYAHYTEVGKGSYKKSYPRPLPCGGLVLGFDRRTTEMLGHRILLDRGLCQVEFTVGGQARRLEVFLEHAADRLWARTTDLAGKPAPGPFTYLGIVPDGAIPAEFPRAEHALEAEAGTLAYRQTLPYEEITTPGAFRPHPKDRAFCLAARTNARLTPKSALPRGIRVGARLESEAPFLLAVGLDQGPAAAVALDSRQMPAPTWEACQAAAEAAAAGWRAYWQKSAVALSDELLERTWYWNMYFLRCALSAGTVSPGVYAICPCPNKPTVWHGDYHFDYNTAQAYWSTFSSNHPELNLPYVEMVNRLLPTCRQWARDYYRMRGAYFPVSAYPVEMRTYPYAAPVFNWMIGVSAWAMQGLWWHYLYTMDVEFLRERAFEPIKQIVLFLVDYLQRPDVLAEPWGDRFCHVFPTFPPELYHLKPGLPKEFNADTIVDLALIRFAFLAYLRACQALGREVAEAADRRVVEDLVSRLPPYPTASSSRGKVFVSVRGATAEEVYNVPVSLMSVFPGEHHGLHSPPDDYAVAANTYRNQQNEGGNDLVFLNLQAARLGLLDLEKFKRQIRYTLMPDGTCTDKNLQVGGRFGFGPREYDWMAGYGIWFENFSLPVVINECLLQGYQGELRFFPNWPKDRPAEFRSLRTVGAFLVSAACRSGQVQWVEVVSEKGGTLTVISPWEKGAIYVRNQERVATAQARFSLATQPGEVVRLLPPT